MLILYFSFETSFLKNQKLFLIKWSTDFLVKITMIENATFPQKTALSKANVMTNNIGSRK